MTSSTKTILDNSILFGLASLVLIVMVASLLSGCNDDDGLYQAIPGTNQDAGTGDSAKPEPTTDAGNIPSTCSDPAPHQFVLQSFNGCKSESKLTAVIRNSGKEAYFEGKPVQGGTETTITSEQGDCGPSEVAMVSNSGTTAIQASETVKFFTVNEEGANIVWTYLNGSTPQEATYSSIPWRNMLLDLLDCSQYARKGTTCHIKNLQIPANTVTLKGESDNANSNICGRLHVILQSN